MSASRAFSASARYIAPVSSRTKSSASASRFASVLFPTPAGPSMAITGRLRSLIYSSSGFFRGLRAGGFSPPRDFSIRPLEPARLLGPRLSARSCAALETARPPLASACSRPDRRLASPQISRQTTFRFQAHSFRTASVLRPRLRASPMACVRRLSRILPHASVSLAPPEPSPAFPVGRSFHGLRSPPAAPSRFTNGFRSPSRGGPRFTNGLALGAFTLHPRLPLPPAAPPSRFTHGFRSPSRGGPRFTNGLALRLRASPTASALRPQLRLALHPRLPLSIPRRTSLHKRSRAGPSRFTHGFRSPQSFTLHPRLPLTTRSSAFTLHPRLPLSIPRRPSLHKRPRSSAFTLHPRLPLSARRSFALHPRLPLSTRSSAFTLHPRLPLSARSSPSRFTHGFRSPPAAPPSRFTQGFRSPPAVLHASPTASALHPAAAFPRRLSLRPGPCKS